MRIAFFDLDNTLLAGNSGVHWIRQERRAGHLTWWQALKASLGIVRYAFGFAALEDALAAAISELAGTPADALRGRVEVFFQHTVRRMYRPGALEAIVSHRAAGDLVVLLTSSSEYLSRLVADDLRLDGILCNRLELDDCRHHTGRSIGPLCYGEGKRTYAEGYAEERRVPMTDCVFYTDSYSDLPLMEVVGTAVAVNPDPRLRRAAQRRGWTIVDWGRPAPQELAAATYREAPR